MNIVEYALEQVDNEAFPVDRKINAFEINEIRRIAEEKAKGMPGSTESNIAFTLIGEAFKYGFLGAGSLSWSGLLYSAIFMVVMMFISVIIFNRVERNFMDTV